MKIDVLKGAFFLTSFFTYNTISGEENLDSRVTTLENKMDKASTRTAYGNYGANAASGRPQNDGIGIFFTADLLVWKLYIGGAFEIGSTTEVMGVQAINNVTPDLLILANRTATQDILIGAHDLHFKWEPGYRVGMGYKTPHDGWDIYSNFTHYITHGTETSQESIPPLIGTQRTTNSTATFADPGNSATTTSTLRRDFHFYDWTLELEKSYFISKNLSFMPHFGIRMSWLRQKMNANYTLPILASSTGPVTTPTTSSSSSTTTTILSGKNNFWGIGPNIGIDANWYLGQNVSLYGLLSGAVLWGQYHLSYEKDVTILYADSTQDTLTSDLRSKPHRIAPMVQLGLGVEYASLFNQNTMSFALSIGYELEYWWRQNFLNYRNFNSPDDLGMHGLIVQARFDF